MNKKDMAKSHMDTAFTQYNRANDRLDNAKGTSDINDKLRKLIEAQGLCMSAYEFHRVAMLYTIELSIRHKHLNEDGEHLSAKIRELQISLSQRIGKVLEGFYYRESQPQAVGEYVADEKKDFHVHELEDGRKVIMTGTSSYVTIEGAANTLRAQLKYIKSLEKEADQAEKGLNDKDEEIAGLQRSVKSQWETIRSLQAQASPTPPPTSGSQESSQVSADIRNLQQSVKSTQAWLNDTMRRVSALEEDKNGGA